MLDFCMCVFLCLIHRCLNLVGTQTTEQHNGMIGFSAILNKSRTLLK